MKYIVYCTTCLENGKIYIGVHKTEDPDIFDGYIGCGLTCVPKHPKTAFHYAVKKYGYKKFKRATLFVYDKIDDAYRKEAEIVTKEFVKRNDNYNSIVGGVIQYSNFDVLFQYDFDGNFIKKWDSVKSAVEFFGCNSNRFNMAIKEKRSALGCFWSKTYSEKLDVSTFRKSNHQEVWCYYKNGEIYKKYNNATDAQKDLKLTKASINDAISHRKCLKGFYFISDILKSDDIIKQNNLIYNLSDNSISRYSNGKLIQTYPSIKQAARETNSTFQTIKRKILSKDGSWDYGCSEKYQAFAKPQHVKIAQYDTNGDLVKIWDSLFECQKEHPKVRDVLRGGRKHSHGYAFKILQ